MQIAVNIVAILGFGLSLGMFIYNIVKQSKAFSLDIRAYKYYNNSATYFIVFENKSRLPISITNIQIETPEGLINCRSFPKLVYDYSQTSGRNVTEKQHYYSLQMPIMLDSLAANSGFVLFADDRIKSIEANNYVSLNIITNRGKPTTKVVKLPPYILEPHTKF